MWSLHIIPATIGMSMIAIFPYTHSGIFLAGILQQPHIASVSQVFTQKHCKHRNIVIFAIKPTIVQCCDDCGAFMKRGYSYARQEAEAEKIREDYT